MAIYLQHVLIIHLGLEVNILKFSHADFEEITAICQMGPNQNKEKAARLHWFAVLEHLIDACSSEKDHTLTIFAAVISEDDVWAVLDFSRLVQIHVISCDMMWEAADFEPGSPVSVNNFNSCSNSTISCSFLKAWPSLWECFGDGPDWIQEPNMC